MTNAYEIVPGVGYAGEGELHDRARSDLRRVLSMYHHHHHHRAHPSPARYPSPRDSEEDYPHKCPGRLRRGVDTRSTSSVLLRTLMLMPRQTPRRMSRWKTGDWESGASANCEDRGRMNWIDVKTGWAGCRLYQTSTKSRNVSVNSVLFRNNRRSGSQTHLDPSLLSDFDPSQTGLTVYSQRNPLSCRVHSHSCPRFHCHYQH
jgi:hypothetical protein